MRRFGIILGSIAVLVVVPLSVWIISRPERGTTGAVNTKFRLLGPDDKIVVDGFDDPKVEGVACHISRAQTGGMKGAFGVAEDTSDASIACRQIGRIKIKGEIKDGERVFDERRSLLFKTLQVVRFLRQAAQRGGLCGLQRPGHRRQPEEQHQLCSDHELAGTMSVDGQPGG